MRSVFDPIFDLFHRVDPFKKLHRPRIVHKPRITAAVHLHTHKQHR